MDLSKFISDFAEQLEERDASTIKADTVFKDLKEWHSMTALLIIAMVDDKYNVQIDGSDIRGSVTVEDLFNRVKALKNGAPK